MRNAVAWPLGSSAQTPSKQPLIGFLAPGSKGSRFYAGFPEGMREAGYEAGRDYVVEERFADGDYARLPLLAEELVGLKPDVIVTGTSAGALAAKRATSSLCPCAEDTIAKSTGLATKPDGGKKRGSIRQSAPARLWLASHPIPQPDAQEI